MRNLITLAVQLFSTHTSTTPACTPTTHPFILVTGGRVHCIECNATVVAYAS